jgi:hypothetical protein
MHGEQSFEMASSRELNFHQSAAMKDDATSTFLLHTQ